MSERHQEPRIAALRARQRPSRRGSSSPIGWVQKARPFGDLHWWPLLLLLALAVAGTAVAYLLAGRRDLAAGLVPPRHFGIALLGPAVLLATAGGAAGLAHGARTGDVRGQFWRVLGSALVQLPAVWVVAGITLAAFGLVPRFATVGWGALMLFLLISEVGPTLQLDQRLLDVSPFIHVPRLPFAEPTLAPLFALAAIALALTVVGLVGLRRRDIG